MWAYGRILTTRSKLTSALVRCEVQTFWDMTPCLFANIKGCSEDGSRRPFPIVSNWICCELRCDSVAFVTYVPPPQKVKVVIGVPFRVENFLWTTVTDLTMVGNHSTMFWRCILRNAIKKEGERIREKMRGRKETYMKEASERQGKENDKKTKEKRKGWGR